MPAPDPHDNLASPRLDDAQLAVLEPFATAQHLRDGEPLFQAGDRPRMAALHGPASDQVLAREAPVLRSPQGVPTGREAVALEREG